MANVNFLCRLERNPCGYREAILAGDITSGKKTCPYKGQIRTLETVNPPGTDAANAEAVIAFPEPCPLCNRKPTDRDFIIRQS